MHSDEWDRAYAGCELTWSVGQVTAVDFSPVAVDRGRKIAERHGIRVDWVVADVLGWDRQNFIRPWRATTTRGAVLRRRTGWRT